jgi:hypothetical protein
VCDSYAVDDDRKASAFNAMEKIRDPSTVRFLKLNELLELFSMADLPTPTQSFYRVRAELEGLLKVSFPEPGNAEVLRQLFADSLADDAMGLNASLENGRLLFSYPAVILTSRNS